MAILRRRVTELETLQKDHASTEQALRDSEERSRTHIEQANDLIFTLDGSGKIASVNKAACTLLGYASEELLGRTPLDFISPRDRARAVKALSKLLLGEDIPQLEVETYTKDGCRLDLEVRGCVLSRQGRVHETFHIVRDITSRNRVEKALRRSNRELQERNEELDAFARTVTHGLKNPLNSALGHAEILEAEGTKLSSEQLALHARLVAQNARKMQVIIDALLRLAMVRETEVSPEPLDMAHIVSGAHLHVAHMLEAAQGGITMPDTWPTALGYEPWVEEVWQNYISNAIKYGDQPPRIELGATVEDGDMIQFWVRDHGPGLTEEDQAKLFTPFTRLEGTRATGHGLGLSIVKRIVEKLGGRVGVDSAPGQGSTFIFSLPSAKDPA